MYSAADLRLEAQEALARVWFVQWLDETERTDLTLSLRLHIRPTLFVQTFLSAWSCSIYFALIERERRIFGMDREGGEWHQHLYDAPDKHEPFPEGFGARPRVEFLARVEDLLLQHDLL